MLEMPFGLGQVIDRAKPQPQRQVRRGADRPGDRRGLPAALGALIEMARCYQAVLRGATYRTFETLGPAARDHYCPALLLRAVPAFELRLAEALLELHDITSPIGATL